MIKKIKTFIERINIVKRLYLKIMQREDEIQESIKCLARENQTLKTRIKIKKNQSIHVIFVCHSPSLWGSMESVYQAILADTDFQVTVIVVPYRHATFKDNEFHDGGMAELLEKKGIQFVYGYNKINKDWTDLQKLSPDYIFFQTPYDSQFPFIYSSSYVSLFAQVCYVPYYGTLLYKGEVDQITHPVNFFKNVSYYFVAYEEEQKALVNKFSEILRLEQIIISGSPKTDYIFNSLPNKESEWKQGLNTIVKRILWTPRWRTSEGNCHFFEYKDYLLDFTEAHPEIDFLFRPHPLSLQNFIKTGELSQAKYDEMIFRFSQSLNAKIDFSGDYQDTFLTTDILISDMSSVLYEFFMTGKPIIYTHRVDGFNDFGSKLATGFYWVRNQTELETTLNLLLHGEDPLKPFRQELIKELQITAPAGACLLIKETLKKDFINSLLNIRIKEPTI